MLMRPELSCGDFVTFPGGHTWVIACIVDDLDLVHGKGWAPGRHHFLVRELPTEESEYPDYCFCLMPEDRIIAYWDGPTVFNPGEPLLVEGEPMKLWKDCGFHCFLQRENGQFAVRQKFMLAMERRTGFSFLLADSFRQAKIPEEL